MDNTPVEYAPWQRRVLDELAELCERIALFSNTESKED